MTDVNGTLTIIPPPDGYVVDFENPTRQYLVETYTLATVENLLALVFLSQRMYTKIFLMKQFQIEDGVAIAAWIFSVTTQATLLVGWHHGVLGVHAWEISLDDYGLYSRVILAAPLLYALCMGCAKAALALFYRRLDPRLLYQIAVWATIFVSVGSYTGIFFSLLFACKPIAASWDPMLLPTAVCVNRGAIYIVTAVIGVVTDVILIALPIPTILGLQMPNKQKLGLVGIFGVGSVTMVTSIVRLVILIPSLTTPDQTWVIGEGSMWIIVESNLLIMCCSLSTLRRFFKHFAPRLIGESSSGRSRSKSFPHNAQKTWGSGGPKRNLDTLMDTVNEDGSGANGDIMLSTMDDKRKKGGRRGSAVRVKSVSGDGDSEEAILYERTVQVTYEGADGSPVRGEDGNHTGKIWAGQEGRAL